MKTIDIKALMMALNDRPIVYHKAYRKVTGSLTATILLGQLVYWWKKVDGRKFYKTDQDIMEETGLTPGELKSAKNTLKGMKFMRITREGVPAKTYYDIDGELLAEALTEEYKVNGKLPIKIGEFNQTGMANLTKLDGSISPNSYTRDYTREENIEGSCNNDAFFDDLFFFETAPKEVSDRIAKEALAHGLEEDALGQFAEYINGMHFKISGRARIRGLKDVVKNFKRA